MDPARPLVLVGLAWPLVLVPTRRREAAAPRGVDRAPARWQREPWLAQLGGVRFETRVLAGGAGEQRDLAPPGGP